MTLSIRKEYETLGVDTYYSDHAETYHNPHAVFALTCLDQLWNPAFKNVLDLACGDGLVSKHLAKTKQVNSVVGCDKFLFSVIKEKPIINALTIRLKTLLMETSKCQKSM